MAFASVISAFVVILMFVGEDLTIEVGGQSPQGKPDVRVLGSMDALLGVSLGKGMVWPVLTRRLKVGGKVVATVPKRTGGTSKDLREVSID